VEGKKQRNREAEKWRIRQAKNYKGREAGKSRKERSRKAKKQGNRNQKKNGKKIIPEKKNNPPLKIIEGMQQCKALQEEPLIGRIADAIRGKKQTLLRNGSSSGPIKWPSSTCGLDGPCS
jgi:hypothetical protein